MSADRELLELAAKACGYNANHKWNRERLEMNPPVIGLVVHDGNDDLISTGWNPIDRDGDALRLAVKLSLRIWSDGTGVVVESTGYPASAHEYELAINCHGCIYAATRRAIVRAAAAIGESMP